MSKRKSSKRTAMIIHILFGIVVAVLLLFTAFVPLPFHSRIAIVAAVLLLAALYTISQWSARKRFTAFTNDVTSLLDEFIPGNDITPQLLLKETLDSKISAKLQKAFEITQGIAQSSDFHRKNDSRQPICLW